MNLVFGPDARNRSRVLCEVIQNLEFRRWLQRIYIIGFILYLSLHTQLDQPDQVRRVDVISDDVVR